MGTLYDKSGNPVDVPDAQLTHALVSGQYLTDKPQINVRAGGKVFSVPTENLGKFTAAQPDARIMSDAETAAHEEEKRQAALQEKYGGLGSQAKVAGVSALGGATLGLSDVALGAVLTKEQKEELAAQKAANPYTNIGAGIVGAIAPTLLTGGAATPEEAALLGGREVLGVAKAAGEVKEASTIAKALGTAKTAFTAPTRALDAVSSLAERGAAHVVGDEAETFIGQMAQKAIQKAAGGAVTGGLATGAMDVGENAISPDHNLTGEQLLQHMGMGALLGGGLGFAGGAAGKAFDRVMEGGEGKGSAIKEWLEGKAEERQWFATGAKTPETRELAKHGLTPPEVGRWQLENLSKYTEDGTAPLTREGIGQAAEKAVDDLGPKVGQHIAELDARGAKPEWQPILDRLRTDVVKPLEGHIDPAVKGIANRVGGLIDNAEAKLGQNPTFGELFNLRKDVQDAINYSKKDLTQATANSELKSVRRILEDEIGKQGEAALGTGGADWAKGYNATKKDYQMAISTLNAFESADARIASHNPISLETSIIGSHGITGLALGHPLALVTAGAAAVGRHLLKTYGDAVGSRVLDMVSKSGALSSTVAESIATRSAIAAQRTYNSAATQGLRAITRGAVAANEAGRPRTTDGDFSRKSAQVQAMIQDTKSHAQQIQANAQALGPGFATSASAYQRAAMASSVFLGQALPKSRPVDPASPKAGTIEPTQIEKERFNKLFDVVHDPTGILQAAAKGSLTRDMVDAVAQTHPATLKDLQKKVTDEMKTLKEPLEPTQAAAVKMILGVPVFDHPLPPPPAPPQMQTPQGKPKSHGAKNVKLNLAASTGLQGSRVGS